MTGPTLSIVRKGLACPLGLRSAAALAAMRAGVTRFENVDEASDVTVSRLSRIPAEAARLDRMLALSTYALQETLEQLPGALPATIPTLLSLPDPHSGAPYDEGELITSLQATVKALTGAEAVLPASGVKPEGRAGIFTALQLARSVLQQGDFPFALVGAVDSLVDPRTVAMLESQGLLLGENNMDGRIPGEAAAFFVVALPTAIPKAQPIAHIMAVELDTEPASFALSYSGKAINRAEGLARLFRRLHTFSGRVDAVVAGQSCESFWGREFSYAYLRNVDMMPEPLFHKTTAFSVGDVGAAAGAVAIHQALGEFQPQPSWTQRPRQSALVYDASDHGALGGLTLVPSQA